MNTTSNSVDTYNISNNIIDLLYLSYLLITSIENMSWDCTESETDFDPVLLFFLSENPLSLF